MSETLSITQQDNGTEKRETSILGAKGESLAVNLLEATGFRIVLTNFRVPVGRNSKGTPVTGEIDIIALDGETLCFIEVKTRRSDDFTPVISNVDKRKQRQIARTAKVYRRLFDVYDMKHRYDVVTVLIKRHSEPEIDLIKGFWTDAIFKKTYWERSTWYDLT